ncbi:nitrosoguanidine resistance protein SNG1 [Aspergillus aurantiobrunneus]
MTFLILQVLFLGNMSYLYATQFRISSRVHALDILYVDFDGGVIGRSVSDAYDALKGPNFPTLTPSTVSSYATPPDVRAAVCNGEYWAAIIANNGASTRLASALAGETQDSTEAALTYIWNGARYPALAQGYIYSNLFTLVQVARSTYYSHNATSALQTLSPSNPTSIQAFLNPISASEINLKTTTHGARVFYNTITLVIPILQQFFFMMALNGLSGQFPALAKLGGSAVGNWLFRLCLSLVYTFIASICTAGYIWAFRESWAVNGTQFALSWLVIWLYMHINFLLIDAAGAYIPIQFLPLCFLTWIIINISSTVAPFELSPGFFRWGYALPANEVYQVLVQIWSDGCENRLYRALPILFSWWVVGASVFVLAARRRWRLARGADILDADHDSCEANHSKVTSPVAANPPTVPVDACIS